MHVNNESGQTSVKKSIVIILLLCIGETNLYLMHGIYFSCKYITTSPKIL